MKTKGGLEGSLSFTDLCDDGGPCGSLETLTIIWLEIFEKADENVDDSYETWESGG